MEKMAWGGPKWGREDFFPTNPDLANILGRTELDVENFHFIDLLDPKFLDFQVHRSPNSQIFRFPNFQTPPLNKFSDPIWPSPNTPRDQIRRKGPCCDMG